VKVTLEDGVLTIQGERKAGEGRDRKKVPSGRALLWPLRPELTLPDLVDEEKVKAEFKDGVLNLQLPKSEMAKPKAIEVKVG